MVVVETPSSPSTPSKGGDKRESPTKSLMIWAQDEFLTVPRLTIDEADVEDEALDSAARAGRAVLRSRLLERARGLSSASEEESYRPQTARIQRPLVAVDVPPAPLTARAAVRTKSMAYSPMQAMDSPSQKSRYGGMQPPTGAPPPPPARLGLTRADNSRLPRHSIRPFDLHEAASHNSQLNETLRMHTFGSRPPQSIRTYAPAWWKPDEREEAGIDDFDKRHGKYLTRAVDAATALRKDPTNLKKTAERDVAVWELGHNRFFMHEPIEEVKIFAVKKRKPKPKKAKPWKLVESIWAPRRKTCDAKDFYDPPEVKERAFNRDWGVALQKHSLEKKIARAAKKLEDPEARASLTPELFKAAMFEFCDMVYQVFSFYCCFGATDDIFSLTNNSFTQILRETNLVNNAVEGQRDADLQLMFEAANAKATKEDLYNAKLSLDRQEWIAIISEIVLRRHVETAGRGASEAMKGFFIDDIAANVPSVCLQDSNQFRAEYCYTEETDLVLRRYEKSLKAIYGAFAFGTGAIGDAILSTKLMDFGEYMDFIGRLDLIDPFISQREVRLVFIWSRMVVVDEGTQKGRANSIQLHFEDFLEAIVRFAHMMALPTEEELTDAGLRHAGEYLSALATTPESEELFKRSRTVEPGEPLDEPIAWKVRQFILWMVYTARGGAGDAEAELTKKEADRFKLGQVAKVKAISSPEGIQLPNFKDADKDDEEVELRIGGMGPQTPTLPPLKNAKPGLKSIGRATTIVLQSD